MSLITPEGTLFYTNDGKDLNALKGLIAARICGRDSKIRKEVVSNLEDFRYKLTS
jgi:hypothetical protein